MDKAELEKKIVNLENEGFKEQEIRQAMSDEGFSNQIIQEVFNDLKRNRSNNQSQRSQNIRQENTRANSGQNQAQNTLSNPGMINNRMKDSIKGVELNEDYYKIKQKFIRNKYKIYDSNDNLILRAKQKLFRLKEDIKFKDKDGEPVFEVKAQQIMDIAGDYTLIDSETEEPVTVLEKNWTFLTHKWKIKDASNDERLIARFHTEDKGRAFIRYIGSHIPLPLVGMFLSWIPHRYIIESADHEEIGHMKGKLSIRDIYELELNSVDPQVKESIIASAIAIDALEGN